MTTLLTFPIAALSDFLHLSCVAKKSSSSNGVLIRIAEAEAHHRLLISITIAACAFLAIFKFVTLTVALISTWNVFALSTLTFSWLGMFFTDVQKRVREAQLQDSSRITIFTVLVIASFVGLAGACVLLAAAKKLESMEALGFVSLAGLTVISSWMLMHTMLSQHYAHLFYGDSTDENTQGSGLDFPGGSEPDFLDFAYFSFVIGMTFQVSDVEITASTIRRTVLVHSLLSFAFNTVIVAFSINLAASLLS